MHEGEINDDISQGASIPIQNTSESDGQIKTMKHQMSIDITEMLNQLPSNDDNPKSYISRVHSELRKVKEKAYEPVLVSIGPYHYKRRESDLQFMERHKWRYLDDLMKRREIKDKYSISKTDQLLEYFEILGELEDKARGYYEEPSDLEQDAFIKMLLVDACFIIELLQRATWSDYEPQTGTDPLFKANWIIEELKRDLLLVENQIPFFVLERLNKIIGDIPDPLALIFMAVNHLPIYKCIANDLQEDEVAIAMQSIVDLRKPPFAELPQSKLETIKLDENKLKEFKHLLDLTRKFMLIEEILEKKDDKSMSQPKQNPQESDKNPPTPANYKKTYSATELRDLGVTFKGVENRKFYEIKFDNGVLEIPVFNIDDSTETRFRNLVAYEEHGHCQGETIYIGNYMTFMDGLINTSMDVKLLRKYGIIEGHLGSDQDIANIFNDMAKNAMQMSYHYYGAIVQKIREHCNKRALLRFNWNHWTAIINELLMWNFLNTPWKIISVIAASVLLFLTLTQTVYSGLSYKKT